MCARQGTLGEPSGGGAPGGPKVAEVQCRKALTASGLPEYPWALNPYRGCTGGCAFCYSPSVLHVSREEWESVVEVRVNMPNVLSKELKRVEARGEKAVVGISTVTDPYQEAEDRFGVTRFCLLQLLRRGMPVSIITKRSLVTRDLDILAKFRDAEVGLTITTLDDRQRAVMEPGASPVEERFRALRECRGAGVRTYAFLGPYYPTAGSEELGELAARLKDAGVAEAIFDRLTLHEGVRESMQARLRSPPPGSDPDVVDTMRDAFGALFDGNLQAVYRRMYQVLEENCGKAGVKLSAFSKI